MKNTTHYIKFYLSVWFALLATIAYADDGSVLDRVIRIEQTEGTRYQLLRQVSDKTGYLFIYDSELIENDQRAKIPAGEYRVRDVIYAVVGTKNVTLKIIGNHIAISASPVQPVISTLPAVVETKPSYIVVSGRIFDLYSKETIPSATITLSNTNMGTVTNQDGVFRVAIPDSLADRNIQISHVGYDNKEFSIQEALENSGDWPLEPKVIPLQEVVIRVVDPLHVIENMLDARPANYSRVPVDITAFYREGVEHKKRNVDLTEAVLKVYKNGYHRPELNDQVKLMKMRRIVDRQERDTILTKVKSGINAVLLLDVVKQIPDFLDIMNVSSYNYTHTDISVINNRLVYVISFEQKKGNREPLYRGNLYIDTENHALVEAHFEINPEYVEKATSYFVERHSRKFRLALRKAGYTVSYRQSEDGKYFINHVRGDIEFRVRRRRHLFNSSLKVWFELVNCKVDTENVESIPRSERLSTRTVFSETKYPYDAGFWGNFNVILPEEELKEFIINNLSEVAEP